MSFKLTTLGEYAKVQGGFAYKSKDFEENGLAAVLKIKNVRFGNVDYSDVAYISDDLAKKTEAWATKEGDILISMTGSGPNAPQSLVGRVARVGANEPRAWINQRVGRIVPLNNDEIHPDFLFYVMSQPSSQEFLVQNSSGSANQANISGKVIELLPCPKVGYKESAAIAALVRSFDEKITLNTQTNQTLEQMAQALFKSWFVDFDPVIDNALAAGNPIPEPLAERAALRQALFEGDNPPPRLQEATRQLFPDSFDQHPDLGWIPEGWGGGHFGELTDNIRDSAKPDTIADDEHYVGLEHVDRKSLSLARWGYGRDVDSNKSQFQKGDVLFGKLRPYFHKVCIAPFGGVCSTDILVLRAKNEQLTSFVRLLAFDSGFVEYANMRSTGTRMPRASWKDMAQYPLAIPSIKVLDQFNVFISSILSPLGNNITENVTLATLRDTLLPKLLSGELELSKNKPQLEDVF
ncbi:restriction endonuclease subunit S [Ferrimonas sediminicola]|uniref:Restriction endonuclease subunit S n=1 Tax=Ferrimonas sediminicola TaxID=2569538 RepID=A0A4U1BIR2_9GAMM|nr:restriction endonuclease subunit S [Ferrimonas sediminicola]TKB49936.1 restriction endonuclease subunit S [Ferrimonas sediminicola]